jgi:hypothetical protein
VPGRAVLAADALACYQRVSSVRAASAAGQAHVPAEARREGRREAVALGGGRRRARNAAEDGRIACRGYSAAGARSGPGSARSANTVKRRS